jgi:hypothetical protein
MALSATSLVTVAEAGAYCKLDAATIVTDTAILEDLIATATQDAEDYTGRAFITRTITETHIGDGRDFLRLWKWPVLAIASATLDGVSLGTTFTERKSIGRIYLVTGFTLDAEIVITYSAGYGALAAAQAACPKAKDYVKSLVARMHENREGAKSVSISGIGSIDYETLTELRHMLDALRVTVC